MYAVTNDTLSFNVYNILGLTRTFFSQDQVYHKQKDLVNFSFKYVSFPLRLNFNRNNVFASVNATCWLKSHRTWACPKTTSLRGRIPASNSTTLLSYSKTQGRPFNSLYLGVPQGSIGTAMLCVRTNVMTGEALAGYKYSEFTKELIGCQLFHIATLSLSPGGCTFDQIE